MDSICGGELPKAQAHGSIKNCNTHRFCMRSEDDGAIADYQVNASDLDWLRWVFDALDGKESSWLSQAKETATE